MERAAGALRGQRLNSLTGARFLAAGLVFLCHIATSGFFAPGSAPATGLMTITKTAGTLGVSFFFVLSGFVLTWSARPSDTYGGVLRRRFVKIFPNHVLTYGLAMAVYAAAVELAPKARLDGKTGLKILLAEDNPINALLTRELLRRRGHMVSEVVSGEEAVLAMQQNAFDLLLTDIHMPGLDGVEATKLIRTEEMESGRPRTPIVAPSAR